MFEKMNTIKIFTLYSLLILVFVNCKQQSICEKQNIKVGQTWIWISNKKDPFKSKKIYEQKVINIKNGYIQFIENGRDTLSMSECMFLSGAELQY